MGGGSAAAVGLACDTHSTAASGAGLVQSADTFFGLAWSPLREAVESDLNGASGDPVEAVMRRCFEWDLESARPGPTAEAPRDLLRLYYHLLRENERLPRAEQLSMEDIKLVRETLSGTIAEKQNLKALVERLFKLVQTKIEAGRITHAWLVLQIFDYERSVRLWNERNLYLEEMTLRFGERRGPIRQASAPDILGGIGPAAAADLLAQHADVQWMVLGSDPSEHSDWESLFDAGDVPGDDKAEGRRQAIDTLIGRKWRRPAELLPAQPGAISAGAMSAEALRALAMAHIKATYFLLLVSNPTGWEPFLPKLFGWLLDLTEGEGVTLFSDLHRMVTMEECSVREALDSVYSRYVEAPLLARAAKLDAGAIDEALGRVQERFAGASLSDVPAGSYSLTGMVLDEALGIEYPQGDLPWHIHRLL